MTRVEPDRELERLARKERRRAERRSAIMRAARQLLVSQGIENFTVSAVAALAHVSKPAVYYYFESKEELVLALAIEAHDTELEVLERAIAPSANGLDALVRIVRAYVAHYTQEPDSFRILHMWTRVLGITHEVRKSTAKQARARLIAELERRLQQDKAAGRLAATDDPRRLIEAALATAHGLVCLGADGPIVSQYGVDELCGEACRLISRSC